MFFSLVAVVVPTVPTRIRSRARRPPKAKPVRRDNVISARVNEDVYARIAQDFSASNRSISAHLAGLLGLLGEIGEVDLNHLVRFLRAVRAATEAAGEDPGRWFMYARHVPFPANADDPDFEPTARAQVLAAVERKREEAAAKLAGKSVGGGARSHTGRCAR